MKRYGWICLLLCMALNLAACTQNVPQEPKGEYVVTDAGTAVAVNTNNRVYYQIFVGSFSDSNGDGIGDMRGIINRFDYLNDGDDNSGKSLGVEGIWLTPIFASPSYHKYDTTNYYRIDPKFGTEEDLKELIALCHSRNVQIILDLVINHTSSQHPWFAEFKNARKNADTENKYYDYYTYAQKPTANATYQPLSSAPGYYECNFSGDMPELNYDNPQVRQEMVDVAKYYLDLGVDGFRFDAAKYIYYGEESRNADFWLWYMAELRAIKPDIYSVAEVWDADNAVYPYNASTNCFNFTMSQTGGYFAKAAKGGSVSALTEYVQSYIQQIKARREEAMPVSFLANHDMDRAAGYLTGNSAKMAANLYLLMPGSSFLYYGEEIGMRGSRGSANTDANRRLAMLWGDEDTVKNPIGSNYKGEQSGGTVAQQLPQKDSLYNHYKKVIGVRKANPEIANGEYSALMLFGAGGFLSTYQGSTVAVLHNTQQEPAQIELSALGASVSSVCAVVGVGGAAIADGVLTLDGQTSVVLR